MEIKNFIITVYSVIINWLINWYVYLELTEPLIVDPLHERVVGLCFNECFNDIKTEIKKKNPDLPTLF